MTLTPEEVAAMKHAVGMDIELGPRPHINSFYATAEQKPMWESLVSRGFAKFVSDPAPGHIYTAYMLTPDGHAEIKAATRETA